jgi:hypothetical protein
MPGRWLKSLRLFLNWLGGSLEIDNPFLPPIQHEHDTYIMDSVISSNRFSDTEVLQINHCRMYLQAVMLSDLCLAGGRTLDRDMYNGVPGLRSSTSSWIHINQARPHPASWKIWRSASAIWSTNRTLTTPLGAWLYPAKFLCRKWPYYYDPSLGDLYV